MYEFIIAYLNVSYKLIFKVSKRENKICLIKRPVFMLFMTDGSVFPDFIMIHSADSEYGSQSQGYWWLYAESYDSMHAIICCHYHNLLILSFLMMSIFILSQNWTQKGILILLSEIALRIHGTDIIDFFM